MSTAPRDYKSRIFKHIHHRHIVPSYPLPSIYTTIKSKLIPGTPIPSPLTQEKEQFIFKSSENKEFVLEFIPKYWEDDEIIWSFVLLLDEDIFKRWSVTFDSIYIRRFVKENKWEFQSSSRCSLEDVQSIHATLMKILRTVGSE